MWNFFEPVDLQWYTWKLDGARAWLRKNGEEWRLALEPIDFRSIHAETDGPISALPSENISVSFAVSKGSKIALRPQLADRPYLITVRNDVRLLPGAEAQFSIALPPRFMFQLESGKVLFAAEPFIVPNTWFGDKTSGSLCLSLPMSLDPHCAGEKASESSLSEPGTHHAARYLACRSLVQCKLIVRNTSKDSIDLDRLAIFTDLINIYLDGEFMQTDTVVIVATPDGELQTKIEKETKRKLPVLQAARSSGLSEVLVKRGVSFLKRIAGLEPV